MTQEKVNSEGSGPIPSLGFVANTQNVNKNKLKKPTNSLENL
jgi:hypothetical protein